MRTLAACGHAENWICPACAECTNHCCKCSLPNDPVYIDSQEGASVLRRARQAKLEKKK